MPEYHEAEQAANLLYDTWSPVVEQTAEAICGDLCRMADEIIRGLESADVADDSMAGEGAWEVGIYNRYVELSREPVKDGLPFYFINVYSTINQALLDSYSLDTEDGAIGYSASDMDEVEYVSADEGQRWQDLEQSIRRCLKSAPIATAGLEPYYLWNDIFVGMMTRLIATDDRVIDYIKANRPTIVPIDKGLISFIQSCFEIDKSKDQAALAAAEMATRNFKELHDGPA